MKKVTVTSSTGRESDKFMLRFPDGMRDRIKEASDINGRSMNAEIVARLQGSLDGDNSNNDLIESITNLGRAFQRQETTIAAQERMIKQLARILRHVLEAFPQPNTPTFQQTLAHYLRFAEALESGDVSKAVPHLEQVIELGLNTGVLDPDGHPETKAIADRLGIGTTKDSGVAPKK